MDISRGYRLFGSGFYTAAPYAGRSASDGGAPRGTAACRQGRIYGRQGDAQALGMVYGWVSAFGAVQTGNKQHGNDGRFVKKS